MTAPLTLLHADTFFRGNIRTPQYIQKEKLDMEKSTAGKLYVTPTISLGAMEKDHVNRIPDEVLYV